MNCSDYYFMKNSSYCERCSEFCQKCTDSNNCMECLSSEYYLVNKQCIDCKDSNNKDKCFLLIKDSYSIDIDYQINL